MSFRRFLLSAPSIALAAGGFVLTLSTAALAKGPPADRGTNTAPGLNRDLLPDAANPNPAGRDNSDMDTDTDTDTDSDTDGASLGRTVVLSGLTAISPQSFLRFSNLGTSAGMAQVTLFDAESGDEIVAWESASIPGHGAIQVSLSDIAGDADLEDDASYVAVITGAFKGQVQHVTWSADDGVVSDLTACRRLATPNGALGYVSGPGASDLDGAIRIVNEGTKARTVDLALHSAATGAVLGTWESPEIAGHGALEISIADLSAEATAPVAADTAALTVSIEGSASNMTLSYVEGVDGGSLTDLTAGCALRGGGADEDSDEDEEEDDDDSSDDDDEDDEDGEGEEGSGS